MPLVPLLARLTGPLAWRIPQRSVARLVLYARAELNTLVELEQAANTTGDPARAAAYLKHGSDEGRHARMFVARARRLAEAHGLRRPGRPRTDSTGLFTMLGEERFLAFVHHGEGRGRRQFEAYRDHFEGRDAAMASLFGAIVADERRHEDDAGALLMEVSAQPARALRSARVWEAWRTLRTLQRDLARRAFVGTVVLLVPLLLPLAVWVRWARPSRTGWQG